jgi:hypothetical protein
MRVTGETAIRLAERYGLPIHKQRDAGECFREDIPLEDAQRILREGDAELIYAEAEPELIAAVRQEIATGTPSVVPADSRGEGGETR